MANLGWLFEGYSGTFTAPDLMTAIDYRDMLYANTDLESGDKVYFEALSVKSTWSMDDTLLMIGMTNSDGNHWHASEGGTAAMVYCNDGALYGAGGQTAPTLISGPLPIVHGLAVDFTAGKMWVRDSVGYKNGDPVAGTGGSTFVNTSNKRIAIGAGGAHIELQGVLGPTFTYGPPTGFVSAHSDAYNITGTVLVGSSPARREIHVYSRATGELLKSAFSDAATGEYNISLASNDQVYTVTLEDTTNNKYESRVRDFITPTLIV